MDEVEIRRRYEGDINPDHITEDFVLNRVQILGSERTLYGVEGLRASNAEIGEYFEDVSFRAESVELLDDGRWVALITISGRGASSGAPAEGQLVHLMRFDEQDRLKRMDTYWSWEQALRAAEKESW
jgi:hypothetical protein